MKFLLMCGFILMKAGLVREGRNGGEYRQRVKYYLLDGSVFFNPSISIYLFRASLGAMERVITLTTVSKC